MVFANEIEQTNLYERILIWKGYKLQHGTTILTAMERCRNFIVIDMFFGLLSRFVCSKI